MRRWSVKSLFLAPLPTRTVSAAADRQGSKSTARMASWAEEEGACGLWEATLDR
jgi:hypothetical protein